MSIKYYGIYLAYAPTVDLQHEGLGRYLASFLKGAAALNDVCFILACPSWSHDSLEKLCASENVPRERFKIISPRTKPFILRGYEFYASRQSKPKKIGLLGHFYKDKFRPKIEQIWDQSIKRLVQAHSLRSALLLLLDPGFWIIILATLLSPLLLLAAMGFKIYRFIKRKIKRYLGRYIYSISLLVGAILKRPKENMFVFNLFKKMEENEIQRLHDLIDKQTQVRAWYTPTAFWPAFNQIRAPKLMCVPDVVLTDFPIGFSKIGGERFLVNFDSVEAAIDSGQYYVTYSNMVKWGVLVERYGINPENIFVIEHAPNNLSPWVTAAKNVDKAEALSRSYCQALIRGAFAKSSDSNYTAGFQNASLKFLFYASQFRPNKNVISLLKAYKYLLRERYIGHKLILTGNMELFQPVKDFIREHSLEKDVLCLHKLKIEELAAFYKMADLVVNPSLSEGGCPFTFTEALSVDTPVVMARIPVAEEVLTDPQVQEVTFFDPYDWKNMAQRIEWALTHRSEVLDIQRKAYAILSQRSWTDVVNEHLKVLEHIASVE